jgi:hypothetical protein
LLIDFGSRQRAFAAQTRAQCVLLDKVDSTDTRASAQSRYNLAYEELGDGAINDYLAHWIAFVGKQ